MDEGLSREHGSCNKTNAIRSCLQQHKDGFEKMMERYVFWDEYIKVLSEELHV